MQPKDKIGIIAGNGSLPIALTNYLSQKQIPFFVILLAGEGSSELEKYPHVTLYPIELGRFIYFLKQHSVKKIIFVGGLKRIYALHKLHFDRPTLFGLRHFFYVFKKGDDCLLKKCLSFFETYHFQVIGIGDILPELLAPQEAILTKCSYKPKDLIDLKKGIIASKELGRRDIGQAVIVIGGKIVAQEDQNGTDQMLRNIIKLRNKNQIMELGGLLVKSSKPNQDLRVDLPTIGPSTIELVSLAKLSGVAIESYKSLILDKKKTLKEADDKGIVVSTFAEAYEN